MRVQLIVTSLDEQTRYYTVGMGKPWRIRVIGGVEFLVIGNGMGRRMLPMQNIREIELGEFVDE